MGAVYMNNEEMQGLIGVIDRHYDKIEKQLEIMKNQSSADINAIDSKLSRVTDQISKLTVEVTKQQEQMKSQQKDLSTHKENVEKVETNIMKIVEMHGKNIDDCKTSLNKVDDRLIRIEAAKDALAREKDSRNKWFGLFWTAAGVIISIIGLFGYSFMVTPK